MEIGVGNRWRKTPPAVPAAPDLPSQPDSAEIPDEGVADSELDISISRIPNLVLANSWIVSLVFHLVVLILLSLVTYTLQQGAEIELELANSPADDPTFTIESEDSSSSDGNDLDNEMEQLLAASEESIVFEPNNETFEFDPSYSSENMNGQDDSTSNATDGLIKSDRKVGNGNEANFFGINATGKNFVFIVDSSGSMSGERWKNAVRELRNSLKSLQENQRFYVIFFDHQTHLMFQGRTDRFRKSRQLKMVHATDDNLIRVSKWLNRVDLGRQTRPRVSFDYGLSLNPDAVFFLTDGEFKDGTYEYLMGISAQSSNVPTIHTVAFGNRLAGRALEEIANRFNGKFRFVQ